MPGGLGTAGGGYPGGGPSKVGGILNSVGGILGTAAGFSNPITGILQTVGNISSLFRPDEAKQRAAGIQQALQQAVLEIDRRVASGEIDPEAGLAALESLRQRVTQLGSSGDINAVYASQIVGAMIANVEGNIRQGYTEKLNAPLAPGGLGGSPQFQKDRFGTQIRNRLLGYNTDQLAGTPVETLFTPKTRPSAMLPDIASSVQQYLPDRFGGEFGNEVRDRLQAYLRRPQAPPVEY